MKASDSKSDRGVSPSGVQILSPPPKLYEAALIRRGDRAAEGAALEMPCTGNRAAGSNPALSAKSSSPTRGVSGGAVTAPPEINVAVLDGEVAVPCSPQSALAGLNSLPRAFRVE